MISIMMIMMVLMTILMNKLGINLFSNKPHLQHLIIVIITIMMIMISIRQRNILILKITQITSTLLMT